MGAGGSSQQQSRPPPSPLSEGVTNIKLTPDVLERWAMLAAAAAENSGSGENVAKNPGRNSNGEMMSRGQKEYGGAMAGDGYLLKGREFEDLLSCSKESLRDLTDELQMDRVIVGVENDGKPTFQTVGAWKVRQEKEEELRKQDKMWNAKLDSLKEQYVDSVIEEAEGFFSRADKLQEMHAAPKINQACVSLQSKIAECYAANPNEVLKCRQLVVKFHSCVQGLFQPN